jgi:ABC-type Fe3+/spermidine/putrescine transport system ATPase subunit
VTHDQQEALSLSDVVAVMNQGRLEQLDTPTAVYEQPRTAFVADFIGSTNLLPGTLRSTEPATGFGVVELEAGGQVRVELGRALADGQPVTLLIKPEEIRLVAEDDGVPGLVQGASYLGSVFQYHVRVGGRTLEVIQPASRRQLVPPGSRVGLAFEPDAVHVLEAGRRSA